MQQAILKAGEGTRTLDIQLGKLALYQLSYARKHRNLSSESTFWRFLVFWQYTRLYTR